MRVTSTNDSPTAARADALLLTKYANEDWDEAGKAIDEAIGGALTRLVESSELKAECGEITRLPSPSGVAAKHVVVIGLGDSQTCDAAALKKGFGAAAKQLASAARERVVVASGIPSSQIGDAVCALACGCVGQDLYRAENRLTPFQEIAWIHGPEQELARGAILGECVNLTRRLVNEPPNAMHPTSFAEQARRIANEVGLEIEVWDEKKLAEEKCGALLAVAQGSSQPPRLVIVRWKGGPDDQAPLAFVGKGVTFDSGGLSLKPSDGMKTMKMDMAGAATVLGALAAIARLKIDRNVIGVMGLVENMVSGASYKLGDVLTARSGKTIEVLNTDAEGRLVLADALNIALDEKPKAMVDLATLTGACLVALGTDTAGLMTNNDAWCGQLEDAAEGCGELAWRLPMSPHFAEQIKSQVADIRNIGEGRWGGAITAAKFLEAFVDPDVAWTHIDIAGPAFLDSPTAWLDGGGTGAFVRTLVALAEQ